MSLLKNAISRGINRAVGSAVETAAQRKATEIITPTVNKAADEMAAGINRGAQQYNSGAEAASSSAEASDNQQVNSSAATLGSALGAWAGAVNTYANEAAKNMKMCPSCGAAAQGDVKFCPSCGAKLPEQTVAQAAVCTSCGFQNNVGTKFCAQCGSKLPSAIMEEQNAMAKDEAVMQKWDVLLPQYPKWSCGGDQFDIEEMGCDEKGNPQYYFYASNVSYSMLQQYKNILLQNGFKKPVRYSTDEDLYKVINGVSYTMNSSEPFGSDKGRLSICFYVHEFDETPIPQKKKRGGLFDGLFD